MTNAELVALDQIKRMESWIKDQERRIDLLVARTQWLEQRIKELEKETV